ncbi:MAG TPA: Imm1 family immunity protein [Sorangium sp.]|nr:Imm1 family immunity protein [Sorangium sp.]
MSFATTLTTDAGIIKNPTWSDVEAAVCSLDAKNHTLVVLGPAAPLGPPDGEHHMTIGGGKDDRCVVYMTEDNIHFWNLEDPSKSGTGPRTLMMIGGQEGDYREAQCVPRQWAIKAAREYFQHGARAPELPWTQG